ncbi:hypothetical protein MJT46_009178 [Ovis ammon polii x Ovis aries]|nr:hypothetical protein MJT46_009178 [Ovis ammon polii x Ovis aries]
MLTKMKQEPVKLEDSEDVAITAGEKAELRDEARDAAPPSDMAHVSETEAPYTTEASQPPLSSENALSSNRKRSGPLQVNPLISISVVIPQTQNDTKSFGLFEDIFQTEQEEQSHLVLHSSFKCAGENLRLMEADETTTILAPLQGKGIKKIRFLAKMRTPPPEDTAVLVRRYPLPPEWQWKDITSSSPDINLGPTLTNSWKHCTCKDRSRRTFLSPLLTVGTCLDCEVEKDYLHIIVIQ